MIECRPITREEGDAFLQLVCRVFGLDVDRARAVFFQEPMYSFNENWGVFENGELLTCLSKVSLEFGWGSAYGIASVATGPENRRRGLAGLLLDAVHVSASRQGETVGYLFAHEVGLYERTGYAVVDAVVTGELATPISESTMPQILNYLDVKQLYERWAMAHPNRLRRGEARWDIWMQTLRYCVAVGDGYVGLEGGQIREWVGPGGFFPSELWEPAVFRGLESMASKYHVPLRTVERPLVLMARGRKEPPEFFLTDQF